MMEIVYVQKNIVIDAIILCVNIIIICCGIPLSIILKAPIAVICIAIIILILLMISFIVLIYFNCVGIGFNGIVLKRKGEKIPWEEISDIELKIFHGRVLLVQYLITMQEKKISILNDGRILNLLEKYSHKNEHLSEILRQRRKELEAETR